MAYQSSRRVAALVTAVLLCLPALVFAQSSFNDRNPSAMNSTYGNYVTGTVQNINRDLNYVTVRDQSGRDVKIDVRNMDTRASINVWQLRPGDRIAANGGWENGNTFRAGNVSYSTYRPMTTATVDPNSLFGTVQKVNRKLNFITLRDDQTGTDVKVDVRRMDTRQSVNVWTLQPGDPIIVNGGWTNRNTFQANRVNVASYQSMASGSSTSNFLNGTVQSMNRDLNYVTVRDDATGRLVKVDVRSMDTRRSVNVWQLRPGDRIATSGTWENGDTFHADRINF